jgi:hydroxymethylbilane synthase
MRKENTIIIGSRGSQLALYQSNLVKKMLFEKFPGILVEVKVIKTGGDKNLDISLSKVGDKGFFTKEIETALLDNTVDIAVHSLKDLPTTLPEGLKIGAVLERGEHRDALVCADGRKLAQLTENDVIATSSLRRTAGLLRFNKNFKIVDIRGNIDTRIGKMEDGYCDAMILAAAGLQRLNLEKYISEIIDPEVIAPAPGQGAIAIESRIDDTRIDSYLKEINHPATWIAVETERAFLRKIEGGCQVPVGCYTKIEGEKITVTGFVSSLDGTDFLTDSVSGPTENGRMTGEKLVEKLISKGADRILAKIRK